MDCMQFKTDFVMFDQDRTNTLNTTEMGFYLNMPPNDYLVARNILNASEVYKQADIDNSGSISMEEYLVLRHFWTVVHMIKTGPSMAADDGRSISKGPLGGLFLDHGQLQAWFTVANSLNLETYFDKGWDTSLTREPVSNELTSTLKTFDIDGSTRISLEEHYFRNFVDRNGDGWLSKEEYYLSLYKKINPAGKLDNPFLFPINFNLHDWNGDGRVTFLERKFIAADTNQDSELTRDEWIAGDFPEQFGPFDGHAVPSKPGSPPSVNAVRYFFYTIFHECASQGSKEYSTSYVSSPWSRSCIIDVLIQNYPPFVVVELNKTVECATKFCNVKNGTVEAEGHVCISDHNCSFGRGCSYYGFCVDQKMLAPDGEHPRMPRWIKAPSGYSVNVMKEAMERLKYNYTMTVTDSVKLEDAQAPVPIQGTVKVWRPKVTFVLTSAFEQLRTPMLSPQLPNEPPRAQKAIQTLNQYSCTSMLWPNDGFVVVVRTIPDIISNQVGMGYMLISASFVNFVSVFFFFVLFMGHFFWFFERSENENHFRGFYAEGVMDGLWFAMVTVTTVGYGDKTCVTGIGRLLGAFWMLFGLICFGLFGGQVVSQLADMQEAANIRDVTMLEGTRVGLLASAFPAELSSIYGLKGVEYETIDKAAQALKNKEVNAILVPHTGILNYFDREKQYQIKCGNPLKIVGSALLQDKLQFGLQNSLCACNTCNNPQPGTSVYAADYITSALSKVIGELEAEQFLAGVAESTLVPIVDSELCPKDHGFEIYSIIAMFITGSTYFVLLFLTRHPSTKDWAAGVQSMMISFINEIAFFFGLKHRSFKYLNKDEMEEVKDDEFNNAEELAR